MVRYGFSDAAITTPYEKDFDSTVSEDEAFDVVSSFHGMQVEEPLQKRYEKDEEEKVSSYRYGNDNAKQSLSHRNVSKRQSKKKTRFLSKSNMSYKWKTPYLKYDAVVTSENFAVRRGVMPCKQKTYLFFLLIIAVFIGFCCLSRHHSPEEYVFDETLKSLPTTDEETLLHQNIEKHFEVFERWLGHSRNLSPSSANRLVSKAIGGYFIEASKIVNICDATGAAERIVRASILYSRSRRRGKVGKILNWFEEMVERSWKRIEIAGEMENEKGVCAKLWIETTKGCSSVYEFLYHYIWIWLIGDALDGLEIALENIFKMLM
eukprot:g5562.t1